MCVCVRERERVLCYECEGFSIISIIVFSKPTFYLLSTDAVRAETELLALVLHAFLVTHGCQCLATSGGSADQLLACTLIDLCIN